MGHTHGTQWTDEMVSEKIQECVSAMNISRMPSRYVDDAVKVDVKTANQTLANGSKSWSFNLEKINPTCDLYFLIARKGNEDAIYIVPSAINQSQICIGNNTKYEVYRDRYDIVEAMVRVLKRYCEV